MSTGVKVNNTDELKIAQYHDRGVLKKEIRSYEVSLWTLQDDFITVLKWSDVEQKGRIENPMLTLNVDGTQKFTFSIPMYYRPNGQLIENPNWYTVLQGQLIMGLRKVKVIFNKGEEDSAIDDASRARIRSSHTFELVITKVIEVHDSDQLRCNIECEGLAFHELGKIGYKYNLSQDNFLLDKKEWDECTANPKYWTKRDGTQSTIEPLNTVQYWCEECDLLPTPNDTSLMKPRVWYYKIQMNWNSFNSASNRDINKVYEEEYISSWDDNTLQPATIASVREKARPVDIKESNLYNITQTIAEAFGIYCRYEYGYDDNYHIISKQIIFYNNYFDENNLISFVYPYSTNQISREMDATELTTKMYVRPQDSDAVVSGQINIADCTANKMREDYLLNFDYMHTIGAINNEQYDAIPYYEVDMRNKNIQLDTMNRQLNAYEETRIKQEALAAVYEKSVTLDQETLDKNTALYGRLDANDGVQDGYFTRTAAHPYSTYIKQDAGGRYYISLSTEDKGIKIDSLLIYRVYNSANTKFKNQINYYTVVPDEYGYPKELTLPSFTMSFTHEGTLTTVTPVNNGNTDWEITTEDDPTIDSTPPSSDSALVYLLYKYQPELYYDEVNKIWTNKLNNDIAARDAARAAADTAKASYDTLKVTYDALITEKNQAIQRFNAMMGPALREGYWQPEDYKDYGDNRTATFALTNLYNEYTLINDVGSGATIGWDAELFDDENKNYYEESVLRTKVYYPCIELSSSLINWIGTRLRAGETPSFLFNNNYYKTLSNDEKFLIQNLTIFTFGSQAQLGFIVANGSSTIKPVLILTGTDSMTDEQIAFMKGTGNPRFGVVTTIVDENITKIQVDNSVSVSSNFINNPQNYFIVYPRIKISSNDLNISSIVIKYNNTVLNNFDDYEILSKTITRFGKAYFEYFITVKPKVLFKMGSYTQSFNMSYTLSNAATCIYLDAQEVLRDSSKPRVSYTVDVNALDANYLSTLYKDLTQLVMINDTQLKFDNVFGYISQVELNLDAPWEDKIEVKNYKTKFEDLFSTIVASSENMRSNQAAYDAAASGQIPLTQDALIKMISDNTPLLTNYLDTGIGASAYVKEMLADVFTEAGAILASSNTALNDVRSLTLRNAEILSGFVENISADLIPKVINSSIKPKDFKVGDIWNKVDENGNVIARYVATSGSDDAAGGFTQTFDGTLAQITGAALDIDAVAGKISLEAQNQIDIKSGGNLYIAADDKVDIVGNREVNIGGTTINIASATNDGSVGGINIVSTRYDNVTNSETGLDNTGSSSLTKVLIHPDKIEMGGANIIMKGSNILQMKVSRNTLATTSALSISPEDGIWIGSGKGVVLYSGNVQVQENSDGTFDIASTNATGVNIELMPKHLLLGVSNTANDTTSIKMTDTYLVFAAGNVLQHDAWTANHSYAENDIVKFHHITYKCKTTHTSGNQFNTSYWDEYDPDASLAVTGQTSGLVGVKLTKSSIGLATQSGNNINAILMNDKGVTIGSGNFNLDVATSSLLANGSVVRISSSGIDIGSSGHIFIDTNNFKINSSATGSTSNLELKYSQNSNLVTGIKFTQNDGLYVHGNIINDQLAIINSASYSIGGTSYGPGIYLTNNSINSTAAAFYKNNVAYYAWTYNGQTYYITDNSGTSHTVTSSETVYQYNYKLRAVAPRYARKPVQTDVTDNENNILYSYITYYITTDGKNFAKDSSNNNIPYDGSASPTAAWYLAIPAAQRSTYAYEYSQSSKELITVTNLTGVVLTRTIDVTFSVIANTGYVTLTAGQLGNCNVNPQGITGGNIIGCDVVSTNLKGCTIEDNYSTGYYGRCFYDYSFSRDDGILVLKRIDGTNEVIDIKTAISVSTEGGSTGDSGSSSSSTGGGEVSGCEGSCTGECTYGCYNTCQYDCTGRCVRGCLTSCTGECGNNCGTECSSACRGTCGNGCGGNCGSSCGEACDQGCGNNCGDGCSSGCGSQCTGTCSTRCTSGCTGSCGGITASPGPQW